jgi:hypothetical protein
MNSIQIVAYLVFILIFLTIGYNAANMVEGFEERNFYNQRRNYARQHLRQFFRKQVTPPQVCLGYAACNNYCSKGTQYNSSTTCGVACNVASPPVYGVNTGTCSASSTFCPGGTYTLNANSLGQPYSDCDNGYGCAPGAGCCVLISGISTSGNIYFCLTCNN